jgi:hypothetical protein
MQNKTTVTALGVVAAFALACGFGSDDSTTGSSGSNGGSDKQQQTTASGGGKLNQPVRDGKFEFTLTKMKCGAKKVGSAGLYDKAQGEFCIVNITIKNIGDESQIFDSPTQKAFDAEGTQYSSDTQAEGYANPQSAVFEKINPGNQIKTQLVYDVPKGTKLTKMELHDSPLSGGVTVSLV